MSTTLLISIVAMISALTFYTIGVWSEKFAGRLKWWHLAFFWLGFTADTVGTTLMGRMAGSFTINIHSITGLAAILLMFVHAAWATIVLLRKDEKAAISFHRFSILVWALWLIPFVSGLALAMFGPSLDIGALLASPSIHMETGALVLIASLASFIVAGWLTWKKQPLTSLASRLFIVTQVALIAQLLMGIGLVEEGFGSFQFYTHYLGGIAPLAFFLLFYWLRPNDRMKETRLAMVMSGAALLFVLMAFAAGSMHVLG